MNVAAGAKTIRSAARNTQRRPPTLPWIMMHLRRTAKNIKPLLARRWPVRTRHLRRPRKEGIRRRR